MQHDLYKRPSYSSPNLRPRLYLVESCIPILLGPKYNIPPIPVIANPTHHSLSALILCTTSPLCNLLFQFSGTSRPFLTLRFAGLRGASRLAFAVGAAEAEVMGLSVVVGSICGGS